MLSMVLVIFFTSLIISLVAIPSIIRVAKHTGLYDEPDSRKHHSSRTPTLGGVAIFASLLISLSFWGSSSSFAQLQYVFCTLVIMFFIGIKDDIFTIVAHKKLLVQVLTAFILVHFSEIRLTSLYGIFGIYEIGKEFSYFLSVFSIVGITNSINFIDGINGLAGSIGVVISFMFGFFFFQNGVEAWATLSFSLLGSCLGFLYFNKSPAKIFMGDTGSLILGILSAVLAIQFIEYNKMHTFYKSSPVLAIAVLIIPLFDMIRVVIIRLAQGKSPMKPDRNHLHHLLIDLGFSHMKSTSILIGMNGFIIFVTLLLIRSELSKSMFFSECLLFLIFGLMVFFTLSIKFFVVRIYEKST